MDTTDQVVDDILAHFGTKGMKWGVRRADKKWMKAQSKPVAASQLHNAARAHFLKHIDAINNKPHYKSAANKGHLLNPDHPTHAQYHQEVSNLYAAGLRQAATARGTNPSGTKKVGVRRVPGNPYAYDVILEDVSHADDSYRIIFEHDVDGLISGVSLNQMVQGMDFTDDILTHHGTKGMKWGVRKSASRVGASAGRQVSRGKASLRRRTGRSGPQEVVVKDRPTRKRLKTTGGEGRPAHADAVSPRVSGQIARKSGVKALSNEQLREYNNRLNLEQQAKRLQYEDSSAPRKFVKTVLRQTGDKSASDLSKKSAKTIKNVAIALA